MAFPLPSRRDILRVGTVAVSSLTAPTVASGGSPYFPPPLANSSARAVILLFMDGAPSHIDLFDLKPAAPAEVRGPFKPISTSVPGITVGEHLPRLAERMHRVLQLRSVRHTDAIHDPAVYLTLTGKRHPTPLGGLRVSPDDAPHIGGLYAALAERSPPLRGGPSRSDGLLSRTWFELPETMKMEARTLPGQTTDCICARDTAGRVFTLSPSGVMSKSFTRPEPSTGA